MFTLVIETGPLAGQEVTVGAQPVTLGRKPPATVVIDDLRVSRQHTHLVVRDGKLYVKDLGSSNGTFVNDTKLSRETKLQPGDLVKLGSTVLKVTAAAEPAAAGARPAPAAAGGHTASSPEVRMVRAEDSSVSVVGKLDLNAMFKAGETRKDRLTLIYKVSEAVSSLTNLEVLLERLMQLLSEALTFDRGTILLREPGRKDLVPKVGWERGTRQDASQPLAISRSIAEQVLASGVGMIIADAATDARFKAQQSIVNLQIRSALCVPLLCRGQQLGLIYLDSSAATGTFNDDDLHLLSAIAVQAAIFIDNARLFEDLQARERQRQNFERFLSPAVVEKVIGSPAALTLGGEAQEATVLFADIRNFTLLTKQLDPQKLVTLLNEYFSAMTEIIFKYEGTLDKFIGDAIMAEFGVPFGHRDDPFRATAAALEMRKIIREAKKRWLPSEIKSFEVGIGINTGKVIAGNIGSEKHMQYTVIGEAVNIASRIGAAAKANQILITHDTWTRVGPSVKTNKLLPLEVKGYPLGIQVYEILD